MVVSIDSLGLVGCCTYRYDDTNDTADQLPLVKTGKPAVKMMMMHIARARGVENSVGEISEWACKYCPKDAQLTCPFRVPRKRRER